ncbi:hypothetical protein [Streptomyces sp. NPDC056527]
MSPRPSAARVGTRVSGAMLIVIGAFLLVERLALLRNHPRST